MEVTRRDLIKLAGTAAIGAVAAKFGDVAKVAEAKSTIKLTQAPVVGSKNVTGTNYTDTAAKVYFTPKIDADSLIKLYKQVNGEVFGKVGIKLHTGEKNGPNILPRVMLQKFQAQVPNSNIIETNTLYAGDRYTTEGHLETLKVNGWTFCPVDIMDADGYVNFPVSGGKYLKEVAMGKNLASYDSIIVLTHFKGHAMGGFGGSLKNIAIGMASGQLGKVQVHGYKNPEMPPPGPMWFDGTFPLKDELMERMAESGKATCDHFGKRIVFLNVMRRLSVDCDCAGTSAAEPTMKDVGILASTDILAIDQACCDFVWSAHDSGDLKERILSRNGLHQLQAMKDLKMGNTQYELIEV